MLLNAMINPNTSQVATLIQVCVEQDISTLTAWYYIPILRCYVSTYLIAYTYLRNAPMGGRTFFFCAIA